MLRQIARRISMTRVLFKHEFQVTPNKFLLKLNAESAYISYLQYGNVYELEEIFVPTAYRRGSAAKTLATKAFDDIISRNGKIRISCPYLLSFYTKNKRKYQKHVMS